MPWTVADVDGFKKGLTPKQKETWVAIANAALERCREERGKDCEKNAIIRANGAVEEAMESATDRIKQAVADLWALPQTIQAAFEAAEAELGDALNEPEPVAEPAEALALEGDVVSLVERAVRDDSTATVKIIAPGWGTSGYYSPELLARDGPKVFTAGTKMFWDHQTRSEEAERPEGRLDSLAGELITDALWQEDGADGPGLYADAMAFGRYTSAVNELAPHIGVSIRAMGRAKRGTAEGRKGAIIKELTAAKSVDFVTVPGAGGKVLELFEAARNAPQPEKETAVDEQQAQELRDANAALTEQVETLTSENARLQEALLQNEAEALVRETLAEADLPEPARERLQKALAGSPVIVDGELDREAYTAQIQEAAQAEKDYLASVVPQNDTSGEISGLGETPQPESGTTLKESFKTMWLNLGKSEAEAEQLATDAAKGR
jgi:hypothetical protein